MRRYVFSLLIALSYLSISAARPLPHPSIPMAPVAAPNGITASRPSTPTTVQLQTANPLPRRCGGVTPPGQQEPACCINGFVYIDGRPVAGAEVRIQNQSGAEITTLTQVYSDTEATPFYRASLSAAPLSVQAGETITLTARYSDHVQSLTYTVQPGGQQVDIMLPQNYADDYVFDHQIAPPTAPGAFITPQSVATDSAGNLYLVDRSYPQVQVFDKVGHFVRRWGTLGNLPGQFSQASGVAVDISGNVYVVDSGNQRVQKFSAKGVWLAGWGDSNYGAGKGDFEGPSGIAIDSRGNIYVSDTEHFQIKKFDNSGVLRGTLGSYGTGDGQFENPFGIAIDSNDNLYVVDRNTSRVQKFNSAGQPVKSWGSPGSGPGQSSGPKGLSIDANDNIYVLDTGNGRILKFTSNGDLLTTLSGQGSANGQLNLPEGLAVDRSGAIYVADTGNNRIQKLSSSGAFVTGWGGQLGGVVFPPSAVGVDGASNLYLAVNNHIQKLSAAGSILAEWGSAGSGNKQFNTIGDIAIGSGGIYVLDIGNNRVQQFDASGGFIRTWGSLGSGNGQFNYPTGISVDGAGNVYVADSNNNRVQQFDANGTFISAWGGFGSGNGQFNFPTGIGVDGAGNVYVADYRNKRIQKFDSSGHFIRASETRDNINHQLYNPGDLSVDTTGNIYVIDPNGDTVQKLDSSGNFIAALGSLGNGAGQLYGPGGVAIDPTGKVYVIDPGNNRVEIFRRMTASRPIATITHISGVSLGPTDTLTAYGLGQDFDSTPGIAAYRWSADQVVIGTAATLTRSAASLSPGTHRITLEVRNHEGQWSEPASADIYVAEQPQVAWTMLLYLAGDYQDADEEINAFNTSLENLRKSFHNQAVRIAVQIDGPRFGDTRRLLITPGAGTAPAQIDESRIGEQAMDDREVLASFLRWGKHIAPATHYYLAIADHGQAIQGIAWDHTSDPNDGAYLKVKDLAWALRAADVPPIDVLHLDACSMNLLEVAFELRERVGVLIASQYLGWDYFAYDSYQKSLSSGVTPQDVARDIAAAYADRAHADGVPYTIAALDMRRAESTLGALNRLATELTAQADNAPSNRTLLAGIWHLSQKFESNGDFLNNDLDLYVDLTDWAGRVQRGMSYQPVKDRAADLITELTGQRPFILSSHAESNPLPPKVRSNAFIDLNNSNGLSIFYPQRPETVAYQRYITNQLFTFSASSRWTNFLRVEVGGEAAGKLDPLPGPLGSSGKRQVFLPMTKR